MQEMKTMLLEEVRMKVYGRLKEVVESIVRGVVAREVQRRGRKEVRGFVSLRPLSDTRETVGSYVVWSSCMNRSRRR